MLRFPAAVRELVSLTVREPPELTVKFPWAKMPEVTSTKAKRVTIFFLILNKKRMIPSWFRLKGKISFMLGQKAQNIRELS